MNIYHISSINDRNIFSYRQEIYKISKISEKRLIDFSSFFILENRNQRFKLIEFINSHVNLLKKIGRDGRDGVN